MKTQYYLMAACSAMLMGTIGIIARLGELDAATLTFYRLSLGGLTLASFLVLTKDWRRLLGRIHWANVIAGILLGSFILCFLKAIETLPMSLAIMLVSLAPAVAAIAAHVLFNERLTPVSFGLVVLAFLGFAMLQEFSLQTQGAEAIGLGFALACMLAYCAFMLVNKKIPTDIDPYAKTLVQLLVGALCALPFIWGEPLPNGQDWLWLALAALFPGFIAILFAVKAIAALPAKVFGTLAYLEPLVVVLAGFLLFNEPMSALKWGGCALILASGIAQAHLAISQSTS